MAENIMTANVEVIAEPLVLDKTYKEGNEKLTTILENITQAKESATSAKESATSAKEVLRNTTLINNTGNADELSTTNAVDIMELKENLHYISAPDIVGSIYTDNTYTFTMLDSSRYARTAIRLKANRKYRINCSLVSSTAFNIFLGLISVTSNVWYNTSLILFSYLNDSIIDFSPTEDCYIAFRTTQTITATFKLYVYDITDFTTEQLLYLNTSTFDVNKLASSFIKYADNAQVARYADYASLKLSGYKVVEENVISFLSSIDSIVNNTITVTSQNGGAVGIKVKKSQQYLMIWKNVKSVSIAQIENSSFKYGSTTKSITVNNVEYYYATITVQPNIPYIYLVIFSGAGQYAFDIVELRAVECASDVDDAYVETLIKGTDYPIAKTFNLLNNKISSSHSVWENKNVLVIGDSLTAARKWQNQLNVMLGMNVTTHAKGGMGLIQCVDGENGAPPYDPDTFNSSTLYPLRASDVVDKDLIIFYAGYNNRGISDGVIGDLYKKDGTGQGTIAGMMQYCINRIYEELRNADNLSCKILIVTVDCAGKYPYIDADGYTEYPKGTGQTMETFANIQKAVAEHNALACVDLWHNSGINKETWKVFGAEPNAYYEDITNRTGTYPHNGDQLHKSPQGYKRIGECIVGGIIKAYGM